MPQLLLVHISLVSLIILQVQSGKNRWPVSLEFLLFVMIWWMCCALDPTDTQWHKTIHWMVFGFTGGVLNQQRVTAWALSVPALEEVCERIDFKQKWGWRSQQHIHLYLVGLEGWTVFLSCPVFSIQAEIGKAASTTRPGHRLNVSRSDIRSLLK